MAGSRSFFVLGSFFSLAAVVLVVVDVLAAAGFFVSFLGAAAAEAAAFLGCFGLVTLPAATFFSAGFLARGLEVLALVLPPVAAACLTVSLTLLAAVLAFFVTPEDLVADFFLGAVWRVGAEVDGTKRSGAFLSAALRVLAMATAATSVLGHVRPRHERNEFRRRGVNADNAHALSRDANA